MQPCDCDYKFRNNFRELRYYEGIFAKFTIGRGLGAPIAKFSEKAI